MGRSTVFVVIPVRGLLNELACEHTPIDVELSMDVSHRCAQSAMRFGLNTGVIGLFLGSDKRAGP